MLTSIFSEEIRRFPGLASVETSEDLLLEFFAVRGIALTNTIAVAADDDVAGRKTRAWVRNWLIDLVRKLPYGALRARLEKRLTRCDETERSVVTHHWRLTHGEDIDLQAEFDVLYQTAIEVHVDMRMEPNGRIILGPNGQLEEMLQRVLERSGRSHISDLTYLCARRFPSTLETGDILLSGDADVEIETIDVSSRDAEVNEAEQHIDARTAQQIFDALSVDERLALRCADNANELSTLLGVGRSTAYSRIKQAKAKFVELAGSQKRMRNVMTDVLSLIMNQSAAVPSV